MFPILKDSPLFRGLDQTRIDRLLEQASYSTATYGKEELIAERDTAYSGLMIILKGSVRGEVDDQETDLTKAPQLIAPAFLFGSYNRLPINVYAAEEGTEILTIHRGALFEIMREEMLVMSNFIDIVSNRANYFSQSLYHLDHPQ